MKLFDIFSFPRPARRLCLSLVVRPPINMRITAFITFLMCAIARGNPVVYAVPASDRVYMSSEHLTATISPVEAQLKGTFTFHYRADVPAPGQKSAVVLEIPIWFPEERLK